MRKSRKKASQKRLTKRTSFEPDPEPPYTTNTDKNTRLAGLLAGAWNDLDIERIDRVDDDSEKGWKVTYRD